MNHAPSSVPDSTPAEQQTRHELSVRGLPGAFTVLSFTGAEALSELYSYEVLVSCAHHDELLASFESSLLGSPAYLRIPVPGHADRYVHGIVAGFEFDGVDVHRGQVWLKLTLAPTLWLLGLRRRSRIFQERTSQQVVALVLSEWGIRCSWRLENKLLPRTYCTQYQESDLEFVLRILAEEGIFGYFTHPAKAAESVWEQWTDGPIGNTPQGAPIATGASCLSTECLVLSDNVAGTTPMVEGLEIQDVVDVATGVEGAPTALRPSPRLTYRELHGRVPRDDEIGSFRLHRRVRPKSTQLGDYDFRHPTLSVSAEYHAPTEQDELQTAAAPATAFAQPLAARSLCVYEHHDRAEHERAEPGQTEVGGRRAQFLLEQWRADAYRASGTTTCRRLSAGHSFQLCEHPITRLNGQYQHTPL